MKKNKRAKEIKKIYIVMISIVGLILISLSCYYGYRYIKYKDLIGHYELVEGYGEKEMEITLNTWAQGRKEDLKCDLWNCSGYSHGTYETINNKIKFKIGDIGYITYEYEMVKEGNEIILILKDSNAIREHITKYKKIK